MQEKKRAGRFSPKNTISEVETDGQTDNTGQKKTVNRGRQSTGRSRRQTLGLGGGVEQQGQARVQSPLSGERVIRGGWMATVAFLGRG